MGHQRAFFSWVGCVSSYMVVMGPQCKLPWSSGENDENMGWMDPWHWLRLRNSQGTMSYMSYVPWHTHTCGGACHHTFSWSRVMSCLSRIQVFCAISRLGYRWCKQMGRDSLTFLTNATYRNDLCEVFRQVRKLLKAHNRLWESLTAPEPKPPPGRSSAQRSWPQKSLKSQKSKHPFWEFYWWIHWSMMKK